MPLKNLKKCIIKMYLHYIYSSLKIGKKYYIILYLFICIVFVTCKVLNVLIGYSVILIEF